MSTRTSGRIGRAHRRPAPTASELDVERDSDVPISTQIYWQLAYQIDSGRLLPGARLAPVREMGAALRVNPNTIRAVYRRLADAGYVTSRHGAGHPRRRPAARSGAAPRRWPGSSPRCSAGPPRPGSGPTRSPRPPSPRPRERKRPGPKVQILFAECTNADAGYDAARLGDAFPDLIDVEGALLDDLPDRLDRFHYDLVATTTFHADEAQALVHGRVPVVAMLVGPGYLELVHEIAGLPSGLAGRARLRVGARRREHGRDARPVGHDRRRAALGDDGRRARTST